MIKENTSVFTVGHSEYYYKRVKEIPTYNPDTWKGIPPYFQVVPSSDNLWSLINVFRDQKLVYDYPELKNMTTEQVMMFFSVMDIKHVVVF